jgi:putative effector of murein hydrolase
MKAMKKILPILIITVMIFFAAIDNQEQKIESGILKVHFIDVGQVCFAINKYKQLKKIITTSQFTYM